jgi:hypothetical protein
MKRMLVIAVSSTVLLMVPARAVAAPGFLVALVSGGAILFDQPNGAITYCAEHSNPSAPPTAQCSQIGSFPASELSGTFQINTNGGIVAYITNLTTGNMVLCGSGTKTTTWSCTSIR